MALQPDYSAAWRDLARRRRLMWVLFLGYVPGVALLCLTVARHDEALCVKFAMAWLLVMGVAVARAAWFRCPRCDGVFCFGATGARDSTNNICARSCARCGLEIDDKPYRRTAAQ